MIEICEKEINTIHVKKHYIMVGWRYIIYNDNYT